MMLARIFPSFTLALKNFPPVFYQSCIKIHACRFFHEQGEAQFELKRNYRDDHRVAHNESNPTTSPLGVIEQLKEKGESVLGTEIVSATNAIAKLCKNQGIQSRSYEQISLEDLCNVIDSHKHKLQINEAIKILEDLNTIELPPSSSEIILHILQHASNLLESSSIENFNHLARVIYKMPETPVTSAIMNGINRKFIMKLSLNFDKDDLNFLEKALAYATLHLHNRKVTENIVGAIIDGNFDIPHSSAVSILRSILTIDSFPKSWMPLMHFIQDAIINNTGTMKMFDINFILNQLNKKINKEGREEFYNKDLLDHFIKQILWNDPGYSRDVSHCLESLINLRHLERSLLDYLSAKYYELKYVRESSIENEPMKLSSLVCGLAYLKHKPMFWDGIYKSCRTMDFSSYNYEHLLILTLHLTCLDCYDPSILKIIFSSNHDFTDNKFLHHTYLKLWQKLETMPDYHGPSVPADHVKNFESLLDTNPEKIYPLLPYLERGVGGAMFVKTNVKTRLYHNIDHVLVFRPGAFPVNLNQPRTEIVETDINGGHEFIEDLKVPANCHIIPILLLQPSWYFRNSDSLLGIHSVALESLEAKSYNVVAISRKTWMEIPDNERVSFLMDQIYAKLPYETKMV